MSILQDIYNGNYHPNEKQITLPPSLRLKEQAVLDELEKVMGADFMDKHFKAISDVEYYYILDSFREGFRLGVSLMQELL